MKYYYISEKQGSSGIAKYAGDFYKFVLFEKGYEFVDAGEPFETVMEMISKEDHVHVELGIFQSRELRIVFGLLDKGNPNVTVTLHDPPLLKYPFYHFKTPLLNKISKFYDIYISRFRESRKYIKRLKHIYVLTHRGFSIVRDTYSTGNVRYLPHIINENEICCNKKVRQNFIYLGFIGRNKGIEYALQLHTALLADYPESQFYIAGTALGSERKFYDYLKAAYTKNVHFLGYVGEEELSELFSTVGFSFILFREYQFFCPVSGSVLYNLKKGNIVFTNRVNAVAEIVNDGKNGFFLSGNIRKDLRLVDKVLKNSVLQDSITSNAVHELVVNHSPVAVKQKMVS